MERTGVDQETRGNHQESSGGEPEEAGPGAQEGTGGKPCQAFSEPEGRDGGSKEPSSTPFFYTG